MVREKEKRETRKGWVVQVIISLAGPRLPDPRPGPPILGLSQHVSLLQNYTCSVYDYSVIAALRVCVSVCEYFCTVCNEWVNRLFEKEWRGGHVRPATNINVPKYYSRILFSIFSLNFSKGRYAGCDSIFSSRLGFRAILHQWFGRILFSNSANFISLFWLVDTFTNGWSSFFALFQLKSARSTTSSERRRRNTWNAKKIFSSIWVTRRSSWSCITRFRTPNDYVSFFSHFRLSPFSVLVQFAANSWVLWVW